MWIGHDVQSIFPGPSSSYFPVCTAPLLENTELDDLVQQALAQASLDDVEETRRNNMIVPAVANELADPWTNISII